MENKYRVLVKDKEVTRVSSEKKHGEIIEVDDKRIFVYYTKGKCIYGCWEDQLKKPVNLSQVDILEKIEQIAKYGYMIDYMAIGQIANGNKDAVKKELIPAITYTVNVAKTDDGELLFSESKDTVKEALEAGINYVKNNHKEVCL